MMRSILTVCLTILLGLACLSGAAHSADLKVEQKKTEVTVTINGDFFARYLIRSGAKPIIWPITGPTGKEMTRGYPMRKPGPLEKKDHIHHRSFWFTHGDVNGISFWHEQGNNGTIIHREFVRVSGGKTAVIQTRNDWIGPDGKKHCEDLRTFAFDGNADARWVDSEIKMIASAGDVKFGDTKEGCFGLRVAGSMRTELKKGGRILTSEGQTDRAAWGKQAAWVDYSGPVQGETLGVAIMNHPSSFRYPTYWHVRTYGLFAANPFGLHNFKGKEFDGSYVLKKGKSFTLRYRVYFHKGDAAEGRVKEIFKQYSAK